MASIPVVPEAAAAASSGFAAGLASNAQVIGSAWILTSAIFTTYSTPNFLKYEAPIMQPEKLTKANKKAIENSSSPSQSPLTNRKPLLSLNRPTLLTLYRFSGSLLLGLLVHPQVMHNLGRRIKETTQHMPAFFWPAFFLFVANLMNSVGLNRIGISLTYTSKCAIPLVTVVLTVLMGEKLPNKYALLSLIPIAVGVALSSWSSPTFEPIGFAAAMISCVAQSALNVSSKKVMKRTGLSGVDAQRSMVATATVITISMALFKILKECWDNVCSSSSRGDTSFGKTESKRKATSVATSSSSSAATATSVALMKSPPAWLSWFAITSYHIEYVLSFMFVKLVEPITYGTCDAIRRLGIIVAGHFMFGREPFMGLNIICGIALALLGALAYSIANSAGVAKK